MSDRDDDPAGDDVAPTHDQPSTGQTGRGSSPAGMDGGSTPAGSGHGAGAEDATDEGPGTDPGASRPDVDGGTLATYVQWGALLALAVLAVVATAGLYSSLSSVIAVWIGERYRPIARAVLNFGVLCLAAAGIAVLLRRL